MPMNMTKSQKTVMESAFSKYNTRVRDLVFRNVPNHLAGATKIEVTMEELSILLQVCNGVGEYGLIHIMSDEEEQDRNAATAPSTDDDRMSQSVSKLKAILDIEDDGMMRKSLDELSPSELMKLLGVALGIED